MVKYISYDQNCLTRQHIQLNLICWYLLKYYLVAVKKW